MSKDKSELAIAYSVKRKPKKKMAEGGKVKNESAKSEARPMPEHTDDDAKMVGRNSGNKAPKNDRVSDDPTVKQAQKRSPTPLSQPKMVGSDAFSVRNRDQHEENANQMAAFPPQTDRAQPQPRYNEIDAQKSGPKVPDMAAQHNNGRQPYIKAIEDQYAQDIANANMRKEQSYAAGGMVESGSPDMDFHDGGSVDEEREEMHDASVAAAIMSRKERKKYAEGGEIHSHPSIYSDDSDQADLSRNADEDANEEDQLSFNALRKENYSESEGLELMDSPGDSNEHGDAREDAESDKHDKISKMRSRMNAKRQFPR